MKKSRKEKFTNRDHKGRYSRAVVGARICAFILLVLALLYIYSYYKELEYKNFKFVSPVPEARAVENDYKVKFTEGRVDVSDTKIINMIVEEFSPFGAQVVKQALDIAWGESRFKEDTVHINTNGTKDIGIFAINDCHGLSEFKRLAAWENIHYAKLLYEKQGWQPWVVAHKLGIVK